MARRLMSRQKAGIEQADLGRLIVGQWGGMEPKPTEVKTIVMREMIDSGPTPNPRRVSLYFSMV